MSSEITLLREEIKDLRNLILERLPVRRTHAPDLNKMDATTDRVVLSMTKRLARKEGKQNA
jgi:hypothetical protein